MRFGATEADVSALLVPMMRKRIILKYRSVLETPGPCWIWTGTLDRHGYGITGSLHYTKTRLAHRAAFIAANQTIPQGLEVDHLCRVPPCCNPDHLDMVTPLVNRQRQGDAYPLRCTVGHPLFPPNVRPHKPRGVTLLCKICRRKRDRIPDRSGSIDRPGDEALLAEAEAELSRYLDSMRGVPARGQDRADLRKRGI